MHMEVILYMYMYCVKDFRPFFVITLNPGHFYRLNRFCEMFRLCKDRKVRQHSQRLRDFSLEKHPNFSETCQQGKVCRSIFPRYALSDQICITLNFQKLGRRSYPEKSNGFDRLQTPPCKKPYCMLSYPKNISYFYFTSEAIEKAASLANDISWRGPTGGSSPASQSPHLIFVWANQEKRLLRLGGK